MTVTGDLLAPWAGFVGVPGVGFDGGVPDVDGLPADELLGPDGAPYMTRHYLRHSREHGDIRFHRIRTSDSDRHLHDHPWDFVSLILHGSYIEITPEAETRYEAPCVIVRRAEDLHRLILPDGEVWTFVVTGRPRRRWGFQTDGGGWMYWRDYLRASS